VWLDHVAIISVASAGVFAGGGAYAYAKGTNAAGESLHLDASCWRWLDMVLEEGPDEARGGDPGFGPWAGVGDDHLLLSMPIAPAVLSPGAIPPRRMNGLRRLFRRTVAEQFKDHHHTNQAKLEHSGDNRLLRPSEPWRPSPAEHRVMSLSKARS
jgi:hypothetical protein